MAGRCFALGLLLLSAAGVPACGGGSPPPQEARAEAPSVAALRKEAKAAIAAGDLDAAEKKLDEAYRRTGDLEVLDQLVRFLIAIGRTGKAAELASGYYDEHPSEVGGFHLYATALIAAGNYTGALEVAGQAIALDELDAEAFRLRGKAQVLSGKTDEGIEALRNAVQLAPSNAEYLLELGQALHRGGRVDEAALHLRSAIKLDGDNPRAHLALGIVLRDQLELDEAQVFLVRAAKLDPRDSRPHFELGILQNKVGDNLGAEESLATAVKLAPESAVNWYAYGEMLRINKKYDAAIEAYRAAAVKRPPHPKASSKLGLVLFEAKRFGEAEVYLTGAVRDDPQNPYNYLNLGVVYKAQHKNRLALDAFEKFLQLAPPEDGDVPKVRAQVKDLKKKE